VREGHPSEIRQSGRVGEGRIRRKPLKKKVRLSFTKKGEMRFISHLELSHLFYRASKRADLSLCHSEGFHPMPRIVFATALPVGMESLKEVVDLELEGGISPLEVRERLNQTLPPGIEITEAREVLFASPPPSLDHPSVYWISLDHLTSSDEALMNIKKALEKKELLIHQERKGKERKVDVRPMIERMEVKQGEPAGGKVRPCGVELVLRRGLGRTAKPTEIIGAILGLEEESLAQCKVIKLE
jgi:radical SAM-linked protein